jgi:hypothetical protein
MKKVQMPVAKRAIQQLTGDQLETLVKFGKSDEFKILEELADKEKYLRYQTDFLTANSLEGVNFLRGINVGIDFIVDSVNRAKEELKNRGVKDEFDNDSELK